jgi:elongator complex protein 3
VIRDFPSTLVVAGNRRTSLRQDVQRELRQRGTRCACIRCREVRDQPVVAAELRPDDLHYAAGGAEEHFLSFVTPEDKLAAYVRLSLPGPDSPATGLADLEGAAIIRDLHVYGQSLPVGVSKKEAAQHKGLGARLVARAEEVAAREGYRRMAVIAALGTRGYYRSLGYTLGETYMVKRI